MNSRGFTLIEVLITMTILAVLTVLTTQSIQQAIKSKTKITEQIDEQSKIRDALRIMEKDINLAFHFRDIETEIKEKLKAKKKASTQQKPPGNPNDPNGGQNPFPPPEGAEDPMTMNEVPPEPPEVERINPTTEFKGDSSSIHFVTMNSGRLLKDSAQADFIEVGYTLNDCKNISTGQTSKCLWRRSSSIADEVVDKGGNEVVLLENIEEFELKYLGRGKQDWVKDWKSALGGDAATQNNFPMAVEISLTVKAGEGEKKKKISMQIVASIRFPNNPEPATAAAGVPQ
jgi:prepilin-type N-terminal cleavage/methylation domain-containing protein